jgi:hypothetical protein
MVFLITRPIVNVEDVLHTIVYTMKKESVLGKLYWCLGSLMPSSISACAVRKGVVVQIVPTVDVSFGSKIAQVLYNIATIGDSSSAIIIQGLFISSNS